MVTTHENMSAVQNDWCSLDAFKPLFKIGFFRLMCHFSWEKNMLGIFFVQHTSVRPNFILIVLKIQKMSATSISSNVYDGVTDF